MEGLKQKGHGSLRLLPHQDLRGLSFFCLKSLSRSYGPFMRPNLQASLYTHLSPLSSQKEIGVIKRGQAEGAKEVWN